MKKRTQTKRLIRASSFRFEKFWYVLPSQIVTGKKISKFLFFLFEYSNVYLVGIRKLTKGTDYGRPERKQPSLHGRKFTSTPKDFVCHIGPIFQISLIYAFIGCPQSVKKGICILHWLVQAENTLPFFWCRFPLVAYILVFWSKNASLQPKCGRMNDIQQNDILPIKFLVLHHPPIYCCTVA